MDQSQKVAVAKSITLKEGENLYGFMDAVSDALREMKGSDGLPIQGMYVRDIYDGYIVACSWCGEHTFKIDYTRDAKGEVMLTNPVEVKAVFVPVAESVAKSADGNQVAFDLEAVAKQARVDVEYVSASGGSTWGGLL